jgi:ABC-type multidrug transport system fused ATPase/permease subunit
MNSPDYPRLRRSILGAGPRALGVHFLGVLQALAWAAVLVVVGLVLDLCLHAERSYIARSLATRHGVIRGGVSETVLTSPAYSPKGLLAILLATGLVLVLLAVLLDHLRRRQIAQLASRLASGLRVQLHRQIYRQGQSALPTEGIGAIVDLFSGEVDDLRDGFVAELNTAWRWPVLAVALLAMALVFSWQLALFLLALGALTALAARSLRRAALADSLAADRDAEVQLNLLQEDLGLVRTVRVFGVEGLDKRRFEEHLDQHRTADRRRLMAEGSPVSSALMVHAAAGALALAVVGYGLLDRRVDPARALMLMVSLGLLVVPVAGWLAARRKIRRAGEAATAISRFLSRKPELLQVSQARFLQPIRDQISLENVTVQGPSGRALLDAISLQIPALSRTAIMGRDEDSKHALACLIPRLIDPSSGRVRIDGLDLREVTLESLRAQVAMVFQSDLVFSDTIAANLGLGDPDIPLPKLVEAAKVAHAHHFIQALPQGYDTYIGPLGHFLRVDEQYRIALARAFLHDPSIVVIEEPSGPLDEEVKHLLDDTIARLAEGRTLVFLPHRQSTIRTCQQVIVLHNGRVEAIGAPRDLQANSKIFRHLQYAEFNQFAAEEMEAVG